MDDHKNIKQFQSKHFLQERHEHAWGYADTAFILYANGDTFLTGKSYEVSGYRMDKFWAYIEKILAVTLPTTARVLKEVTVSTAVKNEKFCAALAEVSSAELTFDDKERFIHSHGQATAKEISQALYVGLDRYADAVFYPCSNADVKAIIACAHVHNVCLIPYGGGTNVSEALLLSTQEKRMIVSVDMRKMDAIVWLDKEKGLACVQAGIRGLQLEQALGAEGFTTGHEPDSLEFSTLGGWIATNANGMKSGKYGDIESIVQSFVLYTAQGCIEQKGYFPRVSAGTQLHKAFFGSEGNYGIITEAVIRIVPVPPVQWYNSLVFHSFEEGTQFLQELAQNTMQPAGIRLLDSVQYFFGQALKPRPNTFMRIKRFFTQWYLTKVCGYNEKKLAVATVLLEGDADEVRYQRICLNRLRKKYHGMWGGASNGKKGYQLTFVIAYIRDFLARYSVYGESYETTVLWKDIEGVCDAVMKGAYAVHKELDLTGIPYISVRITKLYKTGACIYFTHGAFLGEVQNPQVIGTYMDEYMRNVILSYGGSISNHHGIGKIRDMFLDQVYSEDYITVLNQLKHELDPNDIFAAHNHGVGV